MAYNRLTGSVIAPQYFGPGLGQPGTNVISGTLQGDGSAIKKVPRVLTPADNAIVINVDGNSNKFECSTNLKFNPSSSPNELSIVGTVSASANISASYFYGDGSKLTNLSSSGGNIGPAPDGSYADGLFTDFTKDTVIGLPIDRFNEVLKALAPSPAPNLDDVNCSDSGTSAVLSFGSSQGIAGYTDVGTAAGFSAVDINGTYSQSTSGNNLRRATFAGATVINGTLNADVASDGSYPNYPADSFGDADSGTLILEVNGATLVTASMTNASAGTGVPGSGTGTALNASGSGFYDLSQTGSAHFEDGTELDIFQHRTGLYKVAAANQRNGWNYLRVRHSSSAFNRTTNYVEWVNDPENTALAASAGSLSSLSMTGELLMSGVKYYTGGSATYTVKVDNAYRNIYSTSNISFNTTNVSVASQAFPSIDYAGGESETKQLQLTASATINASTILDGSITVGVTVPAPLKSNLSNAQAQSIGDILLYTYSNNSSTTSETFRREDYRIISGAYGAQADITAGGNTWDSTAALTGNDGLLFYNQRLYSPIDGDIPNNGDFSSITNGPGSNVDYSAISGTRTFYRYFTSTGAASETNFQLTFTGDSSTKIVSAGTALAAAKIHVFVKLPTTSTAKETGWLDLAIASANDETQLNDGDGCYVGTVPGAGLSINSDTHEGTFVTQTVEQNENLVVRIEADAAWTGYVSALSVVWGAS